MTPEEYNAQLQSLASRRAIANAMLSQSMNSSAGWGNDRYKHSPFEVVANLGSTYLNNQSVKRADAATKEATTARQADIAKAMADYQSSTPDEDVGAQTLQNIRGAPEGTLATPVTARSQAMSGLARTAIGPDKQAEMAIQQAMTPDKLTEVAPGASLYNSRLGRVTFTAPSKPAESEKPFDELAKLTADWKAGRINDADYKARRELMTTRAPGSASAQGFEDPKIQALQAAFAIGGVSLPAGLRSQAQQLSVFKGLIARNPDKTPDEIMAGVRTGQLDFNGAKRSTAQIASAAAVTDSAARQLEKNFAAMEPLVAKMGTTSVPVIDRAMAQLRQNFSSGGDKDTAAFIVYLRAVAGEYAKLKSGGMGSAAPAEGEMQDSLKVMQNAFSSGGYQGIKEALMTEAANKRASYQEGLEAAAGRSSAPSDAATPLKNAKGWVLHKDAKGNQAYVSPDGKSIEEVK